MPAREYIFPASREDDEICLPELETFGLISIQFETPLSAKKILSLNFVAVQKLFQQESFGGNMEDFFYSLD
jgi:hypothetical protein